jgi:hypothetical protein
MIIRFATRRGISRPFRFLIQATTSRSLRHDIIDLYLHSLIDLHEDPVLVASQRMRALRPVSMSRAVSLQLGPHAGKLYGSRAFRESRQHV